MTLWSHFWDITTQWMAHQGRFFPGSVAWGTFVFSTFSDLLVYKSLLLVLSVTCILVTGRFVTNVLGHTRQSHRCWS